MVGVAYHAGILRALDLVGGLRPDDADLIVGTSAGSVVGAYLRSGFSTEDLWQLAMGTHDRLQALSGPEVQPFVTNELRRLATRSPVNLARLGVGSAAVLAMSLLRRRLNVPDRLLDVFPAGLFSMEEARRRFVRDLPDDWPHRPLSICATDVRTGERVVMGHPDGTPVRLTDAIMASCAIPGVFPPVRLGGQLLVDGGVVSSTNLDVATAAGCTFIVAVAPMAFDPTVESPVTRLIRRSPGRAVAREGEEAVRAGVETLLIRPTAAQLAEQGPNLMRAAGLDAVARIAYDMTAPILEGGLAADLLANAGAASGPRDRVEVRARPLDGPAAVSLTSS